ncbi:MAG: efflux RND transporter permease subunit [Desulfovibrionaceae bacterium]
MDIVRFSIEKPVSVLVGVILVMLFGSLALHGLPYQLSPTVTKPEIEVSTVWPGAAPYEVEREIVEEQEKVLKGVTGLVEMESRCLNGQGSITLTFELGMDVDQALLRVSNKLNEVPSYPEGADQPIILATGSAASPIIWMIIKATPEASKEAPKYRTFFENEVRQYLERIPGVADLFIGGGVEDEMHVIIDPQKLAAYNLTIPRLMELLRAENVNVSAGTMGVGRRDYRIRVPAEFKSPEEIEEVVVASSGGQRFTIGDLGRVSRGTEKLTAAMMHNGQPGIAIGVKPEPGANVLEVTDRVHEVVQELNAGVMAENGVRFEWAYDQRPYINGAIDLVQRNILIGAVLAVIVLLVFLRDIPATVIVTMAIPISIVGSFIVFGALGRTLNVVSMAGISFAVGMLMDNAIVVLENIDRHRNMGKPPFQAAYDGAKEVWGAVIASTLTTVAVFLPVVFMEEEAGQLFKDIAIAVTAAIVLSLFVSISVIPMLAGRLLRFSSKRTKKLLRKSPITALGKGLSGMLMALLRVALKNWFTRLATVALLTAISLSLAVGFFPKMEYLPQGNRNLILNILIPPPGLSYEERKEIGGYIFEETGPYFDQQEHQGIPGIKELFYVAANRINIFGAVSTQEQRAPELIGLFTRIINSIPGMYGVSLQTSIFEQGLGEGRMVAVDVSGADLNKIIQAAGAMYGVLMKTIPGAQIRPIPSLELIYPEVRFKPIRDRLTAMGLTSRDLGVSVDVLMDGRQVGDYKAEGEKKIDLVLKASEEAVSTPEELYSKLVATNTGRAVPLYNLAELVRTTGLSEIRHLERRRTVTLQVTPPRSLPLQAAMETIQDQVIPQIRSMGLMDGLNVRLSGAADKLSVTRQALQWNFLLALVITYLLMSALFGNFLYPFIILFTVPLAAGGGFLGLKLENLFIAPQPMDVVTMLGFVILIGVVVNNAILIVHQSLNNVRQGGMDYKEAVLDAASTRIRPIYMSAATSIFGMLPLVIAPGPGSELYRGLGSVVLGGLALSTIFTLFVIPCLLMFFIQMEKLPENGNGGDHVQVPAERAHG